MISELRIGNWVYKHAYVNRGKTLVTDKVSGAYISWLEKGDSECEPIPLTQEHLLRSGFEKENRRKDVDAIMTTYIMWHPIVKECYLEITCASILPDYTRHHVVIGNHGNRVGIPGGVTDLHQLQNLCFLVLGIELNVRFKEMTQTTCTESYKIAIDRNLKKMKELQQQFPKNYSLRSDWRKLVELNKMFQSAIDGTFKKT